MKKTKTSTAPRQEQIEALCPEAKAFYQTVSEDWSIQDEPGLTILLEMAQCLDLERRCQAKVAADGLVVLDRFKQTVAHPLLRTGKDARSHFFQAAKTLNLDLESLNAATKAR